MPRITVHLAPPLRSTFRTEQIAGMFDLPREQLAERLAHTLTAELPEVGGDWTIGAIVGPSGSGKTTLARAAYGDAVYEPRQWPEDEAIVDVLDRRSRLPGGTLPLKFLLHILTSVGLASPPSWLRPYHTLSTGERFRADVARAILASGVRKHPDELSPSEVSNHREADASRSPLLVLDEFTSTLDRTTARTASLAISKYLRSSSSNLQSEIPNPKFVVLSCHTDFLPWLSPDWILDLSRTMPEGVSGREGEGEKVNSRRLPLAPSPTLPFLPSWPRGSLQRPPLRLAVRRVKQAIWPCFARHHYLTGGLAAAATCYAAFLSETPIVFCAVLATLGWKRTKRITRLVVLPQFQGLGIASRLAEVVADHERSKGFRMTITASHPAIVAWCSRSPKWRYLGLKKTGSTRQRIGTRTIRCSTGRAVASFEYVGKPS